MKMFPKRTLSSQDYAKHLCSLSKNGTIDPISFRLSLIHSVCVNYIHMFQNDHLLHHNTLHMPILLLEYTK